MCRTTPAPPAAAGHTEMRTAAKATASPTTAALSSALSSSSGNLLSGIGYCGRVVAEYYQAGQFSWPLIIYMIFVHAVAIRGIFAIPDCKPQTWLWAFFLVPVRYVCGIRFVVLAIYFAAVVVDGRPPKQASTIRRSACVSFGRKCTHDFYIPISFSSSSSSSMHFMTHQRPNNHLVNAITHTHAHYITSGLGITVGAHRLWAHRSYSAHWTVRVVLMILNSMANQRSLYHWCKDHRVHHKYSETDADPHDARKGFFFAHIGWLLVRKHPDVGKLGKQMDFSDLLEDPVVRFQEFLDPWFAAYMCYIFPAQVASYFWDESFYNGFLIAGGVRYCFVLHCTFLVNSAAHLYGDHPYDNTIHPAENPIVSFFAFGEGWHNWHHKYPFDYSTSEFGMASQYNPSKVIIDGLAACGLVWSRKRATSHWAAVRTKRLEKQQQASTTTTAK
jgi:stearoyl-CoA desaturase (Delta-9 desaturase)